MKQHPRVSELLAGGQLIPLPQDKRGWIAGDLAAAALEAQVILAGHVHEYAQEHPDGIPDFPDMPLCVPPFPVMIIEFGQITVRLRCTDGRPEQKDRSYVAALLISQRVRDYKGTVPPDIHVGPDDWRISIAWLYTIRNRWVSLQHGENLYVTEDGRPVDASIASIYGHEEMDDEITGIWNVYQLTRLIGMTLGLLNCRNTVLVDRSPKPPRKSKPKKAAKPKYRLRVHTLEVKPIRKKYRGEAPESDEEAPRRRHSLHICRGHFKDFRDGPGLFGKYRGVYWWDAQQRGTKSVGIVEKDYDVEPPVD
jgi:hypothetical protein